jgi:PAS domain S-box
MNFINFSSANCRNCYKCLRSCPVKAIQFKNEQAGIIEDRCVACGHCLVVCPQNARYIKSDIDRVKEAIRSNINVVASIAPSFPGAFNLKDNRQIVQALLNLGFNSVEETAIGAGKITSVYRDYISLKKPENVITTCCPSANYLIEKYYPSLIKYMLPFVSPMLAHGKLIKNAYGAETFIVFIGPCTAKKYEAVDFEHEGIINAVLTFEELKKWLDEEQIELNAQPPTEFNRLSGSTGRVYPVVGGVLQGFSDDMGYEKIVVDGIENCMEVFEELEKGQIKGVFIEPSVCMGGCIGGPGMPDYNKGIHFKTIKVKKHSGEKNDLADKNINDANIGYSKLFIDKNIKREKASDDEIIRILNTMGKFEPKDELNCGVCGYNTCREKAQAIFEGMAETNMCLHFMRNRAESLTNIIFANSPNIIIILDENMNVKEFNPSAESTFGIKADEISGKPVSLILDDTDFVEVKNTKQGKFNRRLVLPSFDRIFFQSILYLEKQNIVLIIMNDVTMDEKRKKELRKVKENTLNAAQEVIDKQMRVAQEIASLLGETTAETKVTLTKLKNLAMKEDGEL